MVWGLFFIVWCSLSGAGARPVDGEKTPEHPSWCGVLWRRRARVSVCGDDDAVQTRQVPSSTRVSSSNRYAETFAQSLAVLRLTSLRRHALWVCTSSIYYNICASSVAAAISRPTCRIARRHGRDRSTFAAASVFNYFAARAVLITPRRILAPHLVALRGFLPPAPL